MEQTYIWPLANGFQTGTMVRIRGAIPPGGKSSSSSFNINFQNKDDYNTSDVILHVSVRYSQGFIALNTKDSGKWMSEVRLNTTAVTAGREFEILIACEQKDFRIAINGVHFADFPMRRAHTLIKALTVIGEVIVNTVSFETSRPGPPNAANLGTSYPFSR
ncbi:putative galectin [Trypoxylus dichotomus]